MATVRVKLLPPEQGGRTGPLSSGYRSLVRREGQDQDWGFQLDLIGPALAPGDEAQAEMTFWAEGADEVFTPGCEFEIREGARPVGHGLVLHENAPTQETIEATAKWRGEITALADDLEPYVASGSIDEVRQFLDANEQEVALSSLAWMVAPNADSIPPDLAERLKRECRGVVEPGHMPPQIRG